MFKCLIEIEVTRIPKEEVDILIFKRIKYLTVRHTFSTIFLELTKLFYVKQPKSKIIITKRQNN